MRQRAIHSRRSWSPEEDQLLKELTSSNRLGYQQMVPFFPGRTLASLICRANQKLKITNVYQYHKWEYDKTFFSTPTPINSYVAGFLAADGSVIVLPKNHGFILRLEVANMDLEHLNTLKGLMGFTGPIFPGGQNKESSFFKMTIHSGFKNDLENHFGVIPDKARRFKPLQSSDFKNNLAYLLGLLDGDGCVHVSKENTLSINLTSCCFEVVEWAKQFVDTMSLPMLRSTAMKASVHDLHHADAYHIAIVGARAVCLVQLAQAFARKHSLPILARKWDNPRLNDYIRDFYLRFPTFTFDPTKLIDSS